MKIELDNIYNMDCLEGMKMMEDDSVDMVVTSPPYNFCLRVRGNEYTRRTDGEIMHGLPMNKYTNGLSDSMAMDDYFKWQRDCINEMLRVCKGIVFYNVQIITGNKSAVLRLMGEFAERIKDVIIWDKTSAEPAMHAGVLNSEFELILAMSKEDCKGRMFGQASFERGTMSNVIRVGKNAGGSNNHRAAFPVMLPRTIIHNFTGGVILDPFMGSGTTAIACIKEKRHFIGFELNKEYFDKAKRRIINEQSQLSLF